jgi:protein gp37
MATEALAIMRRCPQHRFQILTKRSELLPELPPLPAIWIGVSVERQDFVHRLDDLRAIEATVRFVSAEPLLGPLHLDLTGIGWLIAGGESGPRRRSAGCARCATSAPEPASRSTASRSTR